MLAPDAGVHRSRANGLRFQQCLGFFLRLFEFELFRLDLFLQSRFRMRFAVFQGWLTQGLGHQFRSRFLRVRGGNRLSSRARFFFELFVGGVFLQFFFVGVELDFFLFDFLLFDIAHGDLDGRNLDRRPEIFLVRYFRKGWLCGGGRFSLRLEDFRSRAWNHLARLFVNFSRRHVLMLFMERFRHRKHRLVIGKVSHNRSGKVTFSHRSLCWK